MKIFYSSFKTVSQSFGGRSASWLFLFLLLGLLAGGTYGLYLLLRLIFVKSLLLGLVFIFFAFPLIARLLFFLFLVILPALVASLFAVTRGQEEPAAKDDVIDVKGKIIK